MERAARLVKKNKFSSRIFTDDDIARAVWPSAVGKAIAAHSSRVKLVRDVLVVEVEDAMWQRQLFPLTSQILVRLHNVMGSDAIRDIEFRVSIPRRCAMKAETREGAAACQGEPRDEAESIRDPVLKKVYQLSRKKAATA
jgi:predicted nucleic acid-binding Zn ribbon protein